MLCRPDIGFIPTPPDALAAMLELAELTPTDRVYDLGCGDGRLLIQAALTYGVTGVGVDVDAQLLGQAKAEAESAGVGDRLSFIQGDLFQSDLRDATVVLIYLLPHLNLRLRPHLLSQLRPGTRLISHQFDMGDWAPETLLRLEPSEEDSVVYRWRISSTIGETPGGDSGMEPNHYAFF